MGAGRLAAVWCAATGLAACDLPPRFDPRDIDAAPIGARLPAGFMLGCATSAHQIEGGLDNDWTEWERGSYPDGRPHIRTGEVSGRAAGSWDLWRDDLVALVGLGANAYRLSVEWSRIEPVEGTTDESALVRYREILTALRAAGIRPYLTLHHFTLPRWVAEAGGWEWGGVLDAFAGFATLAGERLGDLVDDWVTVNEPNVVAFEAYTEGHYPPGVRDIVRATHVFATLLKAHAVAARALRASDVEDADGDGRAARIGVAHHVRDFQPASSSQLDTLVAGVTDDYFNEAVPRAAKTGRIQLWVPGAVSIDETYPPLVGSFDYLGLNYYTRDHLRADLTRPELSVQYVPAGRPVSDLGWDVYPEGLYGLLVRFARFGWPIVVTENGIADAADAMRPFYLRAHLYAIEEAVARGVPVEGYLHWSLMDNFEWEHGYDGRFGLHAVDFADPGLRRTPRPSAAVFRAVAARMGRY